MALDKNNPFMPSADQYSGIGAAAQAHDMVASGGILDGIVEFGTQTLPTFASATVVNVLNIPHDLAEIPYSLVTGDKLDSGKVDLSNVLGNLDSSLNTDLEDYYSKHKEGIDMSSYVAASLVPGTIGIKALRMGMGTTAAATASEAGLVGRAIGTFEGLGAKSLQTAKLEVLKGSPFSYLSREALNLAAAGATVGVVETLAFNTAATLALHSSPYLDKKDAWELAKDAVTDSLYFGSIAGGLLGSSVKEAGAVGLLGFRQTLKPYKGQIDSLAREADNIGGAAQSLEAGLPFTAKVGKGKLTPKEATLSGGDLAMSIKDNLDNLKAADSLDDFALLERKGLLSKDPVFREAEWRKFVADKDASITKQERLLESKVKELFADVSEVVGVSQLVKSISSSSIEKAGALLAGLKKLHPATDLALENLEKVRAAGRTSQTVVMDLKTNTVVNKPAGASIFDLPKAEQVTKVANAKVVPFTEASLADGSLTGMSGSIMYKKALEETGQTAGSLTAKSAGFNFTLEKDLALIDVLANKAATLHPELKIKVAGVERTVDEAIKLVAERKIDLIAEGAASGKSVEELSAMLHMPDAKVMKPDLIGMTNELAKKEGQSPRYLLAEYDKLVRPTSVNRFLAEGSLDFKARIKLVAEERELSLNKMFAEGMAFGKLPISDFKGSGAAGVLKFADASWGDGFQQKLQTLTRLYAKLMNDAAGTRLAAIDTPAEHVLAGGKTSTAYAEMAGVTTWLETSLARGQGANLWLAPNGNSYVVQRNLVTEAVNSLKAETAAAKKAAEAGQQFQGSGAKSVAEMLDVMIGSRLKAGITREQDFVQLTTAETKNYFLTHASLDALSLKNSNELRRLQGGAQVNPGYTEPELLSLYMPGPNKAKNPFALIVKGSDNHQNPAYAGQTKVFTFKDAKELLAAKSTAIADGLEAYTAKESKDFFKDIEKFDNSLSFNGSSLKNELVSKHKMFASAPESRSVEQFFADTRDWHMRNELAVQRNMIAMKHADEFVSLRAISYQEAAARDSGIVKQNSIQQYLDKGKPTPAEQVINQLLAVQNPGVVNGMLRFIDEGGNKFLSPVFDAVKSVFNKKETALDLEALTKTYEKLGIEKSYQEAIYKASNKTVGENSAFDKAVRNSNMVLVTGQLRLDGLNTIVNIIGSPILGSSVVGLAIKDVGNRIATPESQAMFAKAIGVGEAGFTGNSVNFVKLAHKSVYRDTMLAKDSLLKDFASNDKETLVQLYNRLGITQSGAEAVRQESQVAMLDIIRSGEMQNSSKLSEVLKKTINFVAKPSDFVEGKLQFLAADAGLQIAEAAKEAGHVMAPSDILSLMNTITQKLHGNYTASQRPQLFQGTVGAAVGLFQSYQARLVHRVLDVIDSGDKRMLAEMAALQAGIFGAKSLPGFNAINTHLVAENNKDKQDIYSGLFDSTNRAMAEGMLYGVGSSMLGLNLSTRGAVDFRTPNNITEVPSVAIWKGMIGQVSDFVTQSANGADLSATFSHAVQHNVFNRPVQQLAAVMSGYSTTMSGKEAVNIHDNKFQHPDDWMPHWATQTMRMLGGKPLDEAVYLDTVFRFNNYRLQDREKTLELGQAVMSHMRDPDNEITPEQKKQFAQQFVNRGGTLTGFNNWYKNQLSNSTTDAGERLRKMVKNSEEAKQLSKMLGGKVEMIPEAERDMEVNVK
jgi:hypothetical protein